MVLVRLEIFGLFISLFSFSTINIYYVPVYARYCANQWKYNELHLIATFQMQDRQPHNIISGKHR